MKFTLPSMLLLVAVATAAPLALKSAVSDIDGMPSPFLLQFPIQNLIISADLAVRGDSAPVMTDSSGEIVPFNTDGVVTTRDESSMSTLFLMLYFRNSHTISSDYPSRPHRPWRLRSRDDHHVRCCRTLQHRWRRHCRVDIHLLPSPTQTQNLLITAPLLSTPTRSSS